ncbi:MFS transporter [Leptothoe kymatousa]|uniref:MFS transporter n=1 Tax=Leptothoe kymatousa TAU-MAC 1615 TaxID=2364775 RepID=A0ABS5XZV7_9CYAN|nr:MFS transporter [Leptothoe kymatousa]MBT9311124.1 MFS transporter [Leptothoe kymatousa TAU-MAC 1615]
MLRESDANESSKLPDADQQSAADKIDVGSLTEQNGRATEAQAASPQPATGFWPVLKNRNFLTLWGGQVFSQLADKVYLVLMIAIIASQYQLPGQTISGWVSAVMIAFTIPAVLFGSLAGVYVDRWLKQPVLVWTNIFRGALVIVLPLLLWLSHDWGNVAGIPVSFCLLLVITFLVSTLTQFFAPAEQSTIPLIVEDRHLLSANSLYTTTMMASVIIGFAVGEPLLAIADKLMAPLDHGSGIGKDILVGLSYCLAGLILIAMNTGEAAETLQRDSHVLTDIKDGLTYIKQRPPIRNAIIQLVLLFSVFAALAVLAVRLAEVIPALKSSQFGVLLAAGGVGMGIGAAIIGNLGHRFKRRHLSMVGLLGMGAALAGLATTIHSLGFSLGLIALLGVFAAAVGIPMQTTIQEQTPEDMRGKVFGLQNNLVNIALSLPLALAGVAEAFFGLRLVLFSLATIVVLGGLFTQTVFTVPAESTADART